MRPSRLIFLALAFVPALLLASWFVYERAPVWFSATPAWLNPSGESAIPGACEALNALKVYRGRFVAESAALDADTARARANTAIAEHYALPAGGTAHTRHAALVRATFPDGGERLVWLALADLAPGAEGRLDKAAVVFVDAQTGDLLALHTAMSASDPRVACGGGPVSRRALLREYLPLLLALGWLGLAAFGWILIRLRRRRRMRATAARADH